jgi:hypothetical protein
MKNTERDETSQSLKIEFGSVGQHAPLDRNLYFVSYYMFYVRLGKKEPGAPV